MDRRAKEAHITLLADKFQKATSVFVTGFRGVPVSALTDIRKKLRDGKIEYKVVNNRLVRFATDKTAYGKVVDSIDGPTGLVFSYGDPASAAKILCDFLSDESPFIVRSGFIGSEYLDEQTIKLLSKLPSRDVLLAKLIGSAISPAQRWVSVLSAIPRGFVQVLRGVQENKEQHSSGGGNA